MILSPRATPNANSSIPTPSQTARVASDYGSNTKEILGICSFVIFIALIGYFCLDRGRPSPQSRRDRDTAWPRTRVHPAMSNRLDGLREERHILTAAELIIRFPQRKFKTWKGPLSKEGDRAPSPLYRTGTKLLKDDERSRVEVKDAHCAQLFSKGFLPATIESSGGERHMEISMFSVHKLSDSLTWEQSWIPATDIYPGKDKQNPHFRASKTIHAIEHLQTHRSGETVPSVLTPSMMKP
jgi:hypothetical protein